MLRGSSCGLLSTISPRVGSYAARPGASARHAARRRLLRQRRASGCLGTSRDLSCRSSSTTSPTSCVRVPRHLTRLVAPLVVDYFAYSAHQGASARRAAHRQLHHLRRASRCLGAPRGSSRGSSLTTSATPRVRVPRHVARLVSRLVAPLVVDYFAYAARPGASARHAARHAARRRLFRLCRLGTSRDSSHRSSSTTSPTPCVRVPRHVARLVVDFFAYAARPGASARHAAHRRLLRLARARHRLLHPHCASRCLGT
jgi:hypothetical protein